MYVTTFQKIYDVVTLLRFLRIQLAEAIKFLRYLKSTFKLADQGKYLLVSPKRILLA